MIKLVGRFPVYVWNVLAKNKQGYAHIELWGDEKFTCDCSTFKFKEQGATCEHVRGVKVNISQSYGSVGNFIQEVKAKKR